MDTIDISNMCSHLQAKLLSPEGEYHAIWLTIQDDDELSAVVRNRQLHIYRNGKKVMVLAGKAEPKVFRDDELKYLLSVKQDALKLVIVLGKKENIDDIVEMQLAMAKETEGLELNRSVLREGVSELTSISYHGRYYLAFDPANASGKPIACMMVTTEWSDWNNMEYYWLQSVYVIPEYRHRGVFTQMVQWLEKRLAYSNVKALRLYVDKNNDVAKKCYNKLGLKQCHYNMHEKVLK